MSKVIPVDFQGSVVQFNSDGWLNATAIADKYGKRIDHWLANAETKEYVLKLNTRHFGDLIKAKRGKNGGTWIHPKLAVVFARWCSVDFAIWCDEQIDEIIHAKPAAQDWHRLRHETAASFKVMSAMLEASRKQDGKETKAHHYSNEARLVNYALSGVFGKLDRDSLSEHDLDKLAMLEQQNTLMIASGLTYDERKKLLGTLALKQIKTQDY